MISPSSGIGVSSCPEAMVVVSNTSPLVNLAVIGQGDLLGVLYGQIHIPTAVEAEFTALRQRETRFASAVLPACVRVHTFSADSVRHRATLALLLDDGEAEALALAIELHADLVLVDERAANRIARRLDLRPLGLVGVLIEGKALGHLASIAPLLNRLQEEAGFWLGPKLRARVLRAVGEGDS